MKYRLGELFSGAGATGLGAYLASARADGSSIVHGWAVEEDPEACVTYRRNVYGAEDQSVVCTDMPVLDIAKLPSIDALSFSFWGSELTPAGRKKRARSFIAPRWAYCIKALQIRRPSWFVAWDADATPRPGMEAGLELMLSEMRQAGYQVRPHIYRWADYGIPQQRQQWGIVGIRKDLGIEYRVPPANLYAGFDNSARNALTNPPIPGDATHNDPPRHGAMVAERLEHISPGQNASTAQFPPRLDLPRGTRSRRVYRRLHLDQPSYPVTGAIGEAADLYHWEENRALTNRELARLQTFPDDYVFYGSSKSVRRQIGKSMPVEGARIIFDAVLQSLSSTETGMNSYFPGYVSQNRKAARAATSAERSQNVVSDTDPVRPFQEESIYRSDLFSRILLAPEGMDTLSVVTGHVSPEALLMCLNQSPPHVNPASADMTLISPKVRVVIGVTGEGTVAQRLHQTYQNLCRRFSDNITIQYLQPGSRIHSNVYIWTSSDVPGQAFLGSANFTRHSMGMGAHAHENVMHTVNAREALLYFNEYWHQSINCLDFYAS